MLREHTRSSSPTLVLMGTVPRAQDLIIAVTARSTTRIAVSADATAFTDLPNLAQRR